MAVKDALTPLVGKSLTVVMSGLNSSVSGTLVSVNDGWFVMKTSASENQHFDMSKLCTFWPNA